MVPLGEKKINKKRQGGGKSVSESISQQRSEVCCAVTKYLLLHISGPQHNMWQRNDTQRNHHQQKPSYPLTVLCKLMALQMSLRPGKLAMQADKTRQVKGTAKR